MYASYLKILGMKQISFVWIFQLNIEVFRVFDHRQWAWECPVDTVEWWARQTINLKLKPSTQHCSLSNIWLHALKNCLGWYVIIWRKKLALSCIYAYRWKPKSCYWKRKKNRKEKEKRLSTSFSLFDNILNEHWQAPRSVRARSIRGSSKNIHSNIVAKQQASSIHWQSIVNKLDQTLDIMLENHVS